MRSQKKFVGAQGLRPKGRLARRRSGQQVEKIAAEPIFDFDDPKVDVKGKFTPQPFIRRGRIDPIGCVEAIEAAIAVVDLALRCRAIEGAAPVEPVDLDENRPCFGGAASSQHGSDAGDRAAAQIGRNPEIASDPHHLLCLFGNRLEKFLLARAAWFGAFDQHGQWLSASPKP